MHFLTSNFNLISTNSAWSSIENSHFYVDENYDNFNLALLNENIIKKYTSLHIIIYINYKNFNEIIKKIDNLNNVFKKYPSKFFFFYFFKEEQIKKKLDKKIISDLDKIKKKTKILNNVFIDSFFNINKKFFSIRNLKFLKFPFDLIAIKYVKKTILEKISLINYKPYKLVILDCDNTLWGGVIDEDKHKDISYSNGKEGEQFENFQAHLKALKNRGVLLSLCSKNNENAVWSFLKKKGMELQKKDFIYSKINWDEKLKNIIEIIKNLDLRFEDTLFIDDNILEIQKVKNKLKRINTFHLKNASYPENLITNDNRFSALITYQDGEKKFNQYKLRSKFKEYVKNIEIDPKLIKGLKQKIKIINCNESNLKRAEELFNKTNQFNFSLNRYKSNQILNLIGKKNYELKLFDLNDKFGYHGIIGLFVLKKEDKKIIIQDFCLSCRVLSRFVENFVLIHICTKYNKENYEIIYKKNNINSNLIPQFLKKNFFQFLYKKKNKYFYSIGFNAKYCNETKKLFNR